MTISRTGIIGTRFISCFSRLNMQALNPPKSGSLPPSRVALRRKSGSGPVETQKTGLKTRQYNGTG